MMTAGDESGLVRRGYDTLSYHYRSDDAGEDEYAPWLAELRARYWEAPACYGVKRGYDTWRPGPARGA
jgi:hypothetical protein